VQRQRDLSLSYHRLGDLAGTSGAVTATAHTLYDQTLDIARRLAEADPANVQLQRDLAMSYGRLGLLAHVRGETALAHQYFDVGKAIVAKLAILDPGSRTYRSDIDRFDASLKRTRKRGGSAGSSGGAGHDCAISKVDGGACQIGCQVGAAQDQDASVS
jgi:hypothetical protein